MTGEELIKRRDAVAVLVKAQIASCTCQVKTPDPEWHLHNCRYRILRDAEAMIEHVPSVATMPTGTDTTTWNAAIQAAAKMADEGMDSHKAIAADIRTLLKP